MTLAADVTEPLVRKSSSAPSELLLWGREEKGGGGRGRGRTYLASITLSVSSLPHSQSLPGSTAK